MGAQNVFLSVTHGGDCNKYPAGVACPANPQDCCGGTCVLSKEGYQVCAGMTEPAVAHGGDCNKYPAGVACPANPQDCCGGTCVLSKKGYQVCAGMTQPA